MAIKVGGTEVVDNNRQLKNIASIDSGTVTAFNSALNTDPTKGTLTKTFTQNETADITLSSNVTVGPVVSVTKEVPQTGISSKGAWDVNSTASNYDFHSTAANVTLTPSTVTTGTPYGTTVQSVTNHNFPSLTSNTLYGIHWKPDGTAFYLVMAGNIIDQYSCSTSWDLTTGTKVYSTNQSGGNNSYGLYIDPTGVYVFTTDFSNGTIYRWEMTTPWRIDTVTNQSTYTTSATYAYGANIIDIWFSNSGMKMWTLDYSNARVRMYGLTTAYDPSTSTTRHTVVDTAVTGSGFMGFDFSDDGTKISIGGHHSNNMVRQWSLSTAWDLSSTVTQTTLYTGMPTGALVTNAIGDVAFGNSGATMYLLTYGSGGTGDVSQVQLTSSTQALVLGSGSFASTDVGKRITGNGGDVILTSTGGAYSTTGGSAFTDNSTIAAGSWQMFGLKSAGDADGITMSGISTINPINLANGSYDNKTISISSQSGSQDGVFLKSDGTRMYVLATGGGTNKVWQYDLSTAWDVSTASYNSVDLDINNRTPNAGGIFFKPDGTKMYLNDRTYQQLDEYTLSTAWDLSSASFTTNKDISTFNANPMGVFFKPDGTKVYFGDTNADTIRECNLTTAWDISTISYNQAFSIVSQEQDIHDVEFTSDGTKMFIVGRQSDKVHQYALSTAWDISTASYNSVFLDVSSQGAQPNGMHLKADDESKLYVVNSSTNAVYQYSTGASENFTQPTSQYHVAVTNSGGQIDSQYFTDINSMTAAESAGTGTVHYAVSTDGRTTWSVAKGTDGVRPIVRNNSGTWQYNNDAGSSTSNDLSVAAYNNDSFTFSNVGGTYTVGAFWSTDGTKVFIMKGNYVAEARLTTAYDLSTATYQDNHDVQGQDPYPFGFWMNSTGTRMYINGGSNDTIFQYSLSTGFDISGLSYIGNSINVQAQDTENRGIWFGPENASNEPTKMFMVGGANNTVYEYGFTTAGNLSTASYSNVSFSVASQQGDCSGLSFSADGTKMFIIGRNPEGVHQYNLTTAWDISSASYANIYYDTTGFITTPYSGSVSSNGEHLVIADESSGYIYNISIGGSSYATTATWANGTVNDELYTLQQALGAQSHNRMDKTQLDAVADANHFSTGTSLDLMIALRMDTAASTLPTSDGVTLNYDAAALNEGAVLGTDYDFFHPAANKVQIKSLAAQNLKVRVV